MPDQSPDGFEWLESSAFAMLVELQIVDSARRSGLREVSDESIARVRRWLAINSDAARAEERVRPLSRQRGPHDALESVDRLVRLASEAVLATGGDALRESDLVAAYERHLCGWWPFCYWWGTQGTSGEENESVVGGGPGDILAMRVRDIALSRVPA